MTFIYEGTEYSYGDILSIDWEGARTVDGFDKAKTYTLTLDNGSELTIDPLKLDREAQSMFWEVAFPG